MEWAPCVAMEWHLFGKVQASPWTCHGGHQHAAGHVSERVWRRSGQLFGMECALVWEGLGVTTGLRMAGTDTASGGARNRGPVPGTPGPLSPYPTRPSALFYRRWFVNCLAEEPETVAQFLVPRIRGVPEASRSLLPWDEGVGRHQARMGELR